LNYKIYAGFEILEKDLVAGPASQWPTMTHGRVSRLACAHARTVTPQWLGHRLPPHVDAVDRPPHPLHAQPMQLSPPHACHVLIPRSDHAKAPFPSSPSAGAKLSPHFALLTICLCHCCTHCRPRQPPLLPSSASTGAPPSRRVTVCKRSRRPARLSDQPHWPFRPPHGAHRGQSPLALLWSTNQRPELRPGTTLLPDW
jgi:hypothetical protein